MIAWIVHHFVFASRPVVIEGLATTLATHSTIITSLTVAKYPQSTQHHATSPEKPCESSRDHLK